MKITKSQLKQIIKEELKHVLKEGFNKQGVQILQQLLNATQVMTKLVGAGDESAAMQQYVKWAEQNMNSVRNSGAGRNAPNLLTPSNAKEFYFAIDTTLRRHYRTAEKDFKDAADLYKVAKDRGDSDEQIMGSSKAPPSVQNGDEIIVTLKAKALVDKLEAANKAGLDSLKA